MTGGFTGALHTDVCRGAFLVTGADGLLSDSPGESDGAQRLFDRSAESAYDLGLMPELVDPHSGELVGNHPSVFSHIGLITATTRLERARSSRPEAP